MQLSQTQFQHSPGTMSLPASASLRFEFNDPSFLIGGRRLDVGMQLGGDGQYKLSAASVYDPTTAGLTLGPGPKTWSGEPNERLAPAIAALEGALTGALTKLVKDFAPGQDSPGLGWAIGNNHWVLQFNDSKGSGFRHTTWDEFRKPGSDTLAGVGTLLKDFGHQLAKYGG